jgi:uridine kinase
LIIQLVGLPCSGKTTILNVVKKYFNVTILDKMNYLDEREILTNIKCNDTIYIIESAQGLDIKTDYTILLKVSQKKWLKNISSRPDFNLSTFDLHQSTYDTIPANFTIYNSYDFLKILKVITPFKFRIKDIPNG